MKLLRLPEAQPLCEQRSLRSEILENAALGWTLIDDTPPGGHNLRGAARDHAAQPSETAAESCAQAPCGHDACTECAALLRASASSVHALSMLNALCRMGHVATTRQLTAAGASKRDLAAAAATGLVRRSSRGNYACAHLDVDHLHALGAGCVIDCVSALARNGVWAGVAPLTTLHLRARPHQQLLHVPPRAHVHWAATHGTPEPHTLHARAEVAPIDALLQAMRCLSPTDALASVESAVHLRYLHETQLLELIARAPTRMKKTLDRFDSGAQSGFETHTRIQLIDAGHRVRTQVAVSGTSPLDLLVDESVGVETDGRRWHEDRFIADRTKDVVSEAAGIRVLRIGEPHIFVTWPRTLAAIERMVIDAQR